MEEKEKAMALVDKYFPKDVMICDMLGNELVFLVKHPDYLYLKCIDDMPQCKVEPLKECNGYCGINDLQRNPTENEINFEKESDQINLFSFLTNPINQIK